MNQSTIQPDNAAQVECSANIEDFICTGLYIKARKELGYEFRKREGQLYPFLEIEHDTERYNADLRTFYDAISDCTNPRQAVEKLYGIETAYKLQAPLTFGKGGNHIWFYATDCGDTRLGLIHFDPYL